jgi:hypothetical protein
MITTDQLYEVNKLYAVRKDHTNFLDSLDPKYLKRKVGIVDANTAEPKITDESVYFHRYFEDLEAELTEVVKAKLVAEIAKINLKIAVYIGDEPVVDYESALRSQNLKELAEDRIIRTTSAQDALKQSNLRWVRLENGNWTRLPEDEAAATPKEEAIDEPDKKPKSVTHKWEQFEASGPPLPVFFTEDMAIEPPSFATTVDGSIYVGPTNPFALSGVTNNPTKSNSEPQLSSSYTPSAEKMASFDTVSDVDLIWPEDE